MKVHADNNETILKDNRPIMIIDNDFMDELLQQAQASPRLRMNYDLRTTVGDQSQRMLNAMLPGTSLPIHRHTQTTEVVIIMRGSMDEIFYDDEGRETARYHLDPSTGHCALSIPQGQWHTVEVLTPTVIFDAKDGPWAPLQPEDTLV